MDLNRRIGEPFWPNTDERGPDLCGHLDLKLPVRRSHFYLHVLDVEAVPRFRGAVGRYPLTKIGKENRLHVIMFPFPRIGAEA